jgi:hypothetical protein
MKIKQEILEAEYEITGLTQAEYNILRRALDDAISTVWGIPASSESCQIAPTL